MQTTPREQVVAIRLATDRDLEDLADLYARCLTGAPGDERWTAESARRFLGMWLKRQPDLFFVAEVAGRIVGATVGDIKPYFDGPRFTDGEIFVATEFRHLGVARALMRQRVDAACRIYGVVMTETLANGDSEVVLEWFQRLGYKRTGWVHMEVPIARLRAELGLDEETAER